MKVFIYLLVGFVSVGFVSSQELFIQSFDDLHGSDKVKDQKYVKVYDNESHYYRYFNELGQEIFLIKTYNEKGDQIGLSIEKNDSTSVMELIIEDISVGFLLNSTIYNPEMVEIGKLYRGEYSEKKINNFWQGLDYHKGNISIYDHTGVYKIGSFIFKQEIDYYAVLGVDRVENIDEMDARTLKKNIRNIERFYKKLIKKYDLRRNPNDEELHEEFKEVTKAYEMVMSDLGVDVKGDDKFLGIIPSDYVSEERRSNWSKDEGYVPYTKREIKNHQPDSKIQTDELYINDKR